MEENEFLLADRITKIKSINEQYDLENNAYVSFSGGKDSTVLHYLIDEALPGNKIPRVFINTGIEYVKILRFVKELASKDDRFVIWTVGKNIPETLKKVGYPFKSKEHSHKLLAWKNNWRGLSVKKYFRVEPNGFNPCPNQLMYQIDDNFKINISDKCCYEFKKKPIADYQRESGRTITITGMMKAEGGQRTSLHCIVTDSKSGKVKKFHPLSVLTKNFEDWYIEKRRIKLCLQIKAIWTTFAAGSSKVKRWIIKFTQLDTLEQLLPSEKKQCENLWKVIYDEYRRIGYRLRKNDNQLALF